MAVGDTHVFPGFLTPVLTRISFQSHRISVRVEKNVGKGENAGYKHAAAEVRGENTPEKIVSTGSRTHNRQV